MSDMDHRRRVPVTGRRIKPPNPSDSHRGTPLPRRSLNYRSNAKPTTTRLLQRCSSEPTLWSTADNDPDLNLTPEHGVLYRPPTCFDIFASSSPLAAPPYSRRTQNCQGHNNKDIKVVVNVTVEGSPGPIRAMVKLGSSVEDTIKLLVDKYNEEGRTPQLDKDAASTFELHRSYFSLQSLEKSELMGDVGSRSFYLRRRSSSNVATASFTSDVPKTAREASRPILLLIARKMCTFIRRSCKLWKLLVCMG